MVVCETNALVSLVTLFVFRILASVRQVFWQSSSNEAQAMAFRISFSTQFLYRSYIRDIRTI